MKFEELKLCQPLIEALSKVGYVSPTPYPRIDNLISN